MTLDKPDTYYDVEADFEDYFERSMQPEVDSMFRDHVARIGGVRRLLDVGCASGRTSVFTKRLGVGELVGIEIDPRGAEIAAKHMTRVIVGDASTVALDYAAGYFDMLFFTDILEHLVDPWATLKRYLHYLRPDGRVLVVLPNIGHIEIIAGLLKGEFAYRDEGLLDNGHLRFFTVSTALKMVRGAGLEVEALHYRLDQDLWNNVKTHHPTGFPILDGAVTLQFDTTKLPEALRESYFARKLHILAKKPNSNLVR